MQKEIIFVHVSLDKGLVLLRVTAANNQIIFRGDEPNELFEPEDFALQVDFHLLLLELNKVALSCILSMAKSDSGCFFCFELFLVRFLFDFKVLTYV